MTNSPLDQSAIIMTGMHRSGTSLTASLLESAGINFGDRLLGSDQGNPKGHFEDLDFVEFHIQVLRSQNETDAGWTESNKLQVQQQFWSEAQDLIAARQDKPVWGWKDPRTTLFLDFWSELIPQAKYIFVYRTPWEVVDSLFRRGDVIFQGDPDLVIPQWCNYNQAVIDFYQGHSEQCLLLEVSRVIQNPNQIIELVNQKFDLALRSPEDLYESALFTKDRDHYRQILVSKFMPQAVDLYRQLQQLADRSSLSFNEHNEQQIASSDYGAKILQDWQAAIAKPRLEKALDRSQKALDQSEQQREINSQQLQVALQEVEQKYQQQLQVALQEVEQKYQQQLQVTRQKNQRQLQIAQKKTEKLSNLVRAMESSKFWQLRQNWFAVKQKLNLANSDEMYQDHLRSSSRQLTGAGVDNYSVETPPQEKSGYFQWLKQNFPQKAALKKVAWATRAKLGTSWSVEITDPACSKDPQYQQWLDRNYPYPEEIDRISTEVRDLAYQPLISVIVPIYNPDENFLRQAIASVIAQAYPNWELCLADDLSSKAHVKDVLTEYAQQDGRIKIVYRQENGHISLASNSALEIATGEYIALLDHDDLLAPHALAEVVKLLNNHPEADFIYSDEDKVDEGNIHRDPYFKPDWCPDSFLSRMYTCHLGVYRRSIIEELKGFRAGFEGSQDYDLVLRVTEKTENIFHIPQVLYHWRIHFQSTAAFSEAKPYAFIAGQKAIAEAIARRGEPGEVLMHPRFQGIYTVRYEIKEPKLVSIIIPTKDLADTLDVCLSSIFANTTYPNYEVIVIDNGSEESKTAECLAHWQQQQPERFKSYRYDVPFNYSQINNYAVTQAEGDYLLFLNNDTEVISANWVTAMVEQAQRSSIGAVGALLLYPDDTIQHAGVVLGIDGVAGHSHKNFSATEPGYSSQIASINNYSAVTAACLMCRRQVFDEVGGFETDLAIAFNDVDFCLKLVTAGYRNIYLPHVVLYHYESKSRGYEDNPEKQARFSKEIRYMIDKWSEISQNDPCYSPNLTKTKKDYSLNLT